MAKMEEYPTLTFDNDELLYYFELQRTGELGERVIDELVELMEEEEES